MLSLCQNREGGFGPSSPIYAPVPTTCFVDTIIIPIPIILYFVLLPTIYLLSRHRTSSYLPHPQLDISRRSCLRSSSLILYFLLLAANVLMTTLEIVRLALISRSPDLLPLQYIAIFLGILLHSTSGLHGRLPSSSLLSWRVANVVLWTGLAAVSIAKVAGLAMGSERGAADGRGKGTKYPLSDQIIDVAVMAGVYVVVAALELGIAWKTEKRGAEREASMEEGIVGGGERIRWAT